MDYVTIDKLVGKVFKSIKRSDDKLLFTTNNGLSYSMHHEQDCCENVYIEDVCGELSDLIWSPILVAEEISSTGVKEYGDSYTWTFYKFSTIKGSVTIRWYGSSNGYYSESVSIYELRG